MSREGGGEDVQSQIHPGKPTSHLTLICQDSEVRCQGLSPDEFWNNSSPANMQFLPNVATVPTGETSAIAHLYLYMLIHLNTCIAKNQTLSVLEVEKKSVLSG